MRFLLKTSIEILGVYKTKYENNFVHKLLSMGVEFSNTLYNVLRLFVNNNSPYFQTPSPG
jgi:hypothetical protein